jgi:hypothetical protein
MVTHSSTSRPVQCLCMAERTGCPVLTDLWSYVLVLNCLVLYSLFLQSRISQHRSPASVHDVQKGFELVKKTRRPVIRRSSSPFSGTALRVASCVLCAV